ncbi:hypothetical protein AMTR_s00002p00256330 [Amborella trichopoda]|uniref:Uncharacterized protein n=1 Tax=Amborella trichopoda TaxID=13333 RepID=W1P193_AMBTC|nr:hypothetical protein AMTR_s00002p00256330 [Amborella trichopoda]
MAEHEEIPAIGKHDSGKTQPFIRHLAVVPYPGQGHINPMMRLCTRLASKGLLMSIVVTEEWLGFITSGQEPSPNLRLFSIPNVLPSELRHGADLTGFMEAVHTKMAEPVDWLIGSLEPPFQGLLLICSFLGRLMWPRGGVFRWVCCIRWHRLCFLSSITLMTWFLGYICLPTSQVRMGHIDTLPLLQDPLFEW